ncbi:FecCD family ABC transporter permease [Actinoallomurus acaciae]|uniref:FecCD family ABC transporter permease n=1 Tax=Actinoallomurus acaciae TaxID=502577 RepID=A0ABV5YJF9_9ACTN
MTTTLGRAPAARGSRGPRRGAAIRIFGLVVALAALVAATMAGFAVGAKNIPLSTVWDALFHYHGTDDEQIVRGLRIPRTLIGVMAGAGLGGAGALMQAITRNPLADPGVLGINSGASAAVVAAMGLAGLTAPIEYVWFALAGAALAALAVHLLGSAGRRADPVRLALAGTALTAVLTAFIQAMVLLRPDVFDRYRFWEIGSLAGRGANVLYPLLPFTVVGLLLALGLGRQLNAVALGEETGRALGIRLGRTRALAAIAITLLCGTATAAAGPIWFVGLAVPHIARLITGPDQRWLLPYSIVLAPVLLLVADVLGRVVVRPGELQVGLVAVIIGAPVFIALVRQRRIVQA